MVEGQVQEIEVSKQQEDSPQLLPQHDFYRYFGTVVTDIFTYFKRELKWHQKRPKFFYLKPLPEYFQKTNEKIEKYIPIWTTLKSYSFGGICFHVYRMIFSLLRDPEYYTLSKYDRNMLLWAILFHDISKRGKPVVEAKDPIHPFKGAWQTLYVLNDSFKFTDLTPEDLKEWDQVFEGAYIKGKKGKEMQNHAVVPKVKEFLDAKLKDKEFEKELVYLVLLHQSTPMVNSHPHETMLEPLETEVPKYFNKRMFNIFRILAKHDSLSYLIFDKKKTKEFGDEIEGNMRALEPHIK